jgi:hypothetical protein
LFVICIRKIFPDAEGEIIARPTLVVNTKEEEPPQEFEGREFTKEYDCIIQEFKDSSRILLSLDTSFLVIAGDSRMGKRVFAQHMFQNPFIMNSGWNFAKCDASVHDAIVCNDVRDIASNILGYRTLFQSSGTSTLGESRTNCYSFDVNTLRHPIIVTMNREGQYEPLKKLNWVKQNALIIDCAEKKIYLEDVEFEDAKSKRERFTVGLPGQC